MALCIIWEAVYTDLSSLFSENSVLEYLQVTALFFTLICVCLSGQRDPSRGPLVALLAGAASIACIREFDFYLDRCFFDGAWQLLAVVTAFSAITRAGRYPDGLRASLHDFLGRSSFGLMAGGFMTVFVFSRLFGWQVLWRAIMGDGYMRVVKNAVEEGTELLGYTLILIGAMEFLRETVHAVEKAHRVDIAIDHLRQNGIN
ncbi:hypothetical protein [Desulfoluna sp.]|uniref:hypothetical protein n=1 Tax=Desulfoluna sp. TaxID=2045199 RepID=UPI00261C7A26|nr:hypothetical protein [Desulfoluna sp.]